MIQLQAGDIVVIGCDGLWDFVDDERNFITEVIDKYRSNPEELAQFAAHYATTHKSNDNISVIAIKARA